MTTTAADLDSDFELMHVHPRDLIIGPNVRRDPQYEDLVRSIREVGVLQPITAFWNDDGVALVVVLGQRRTLAAIQADRDTVPVYVVDKPDDVRRLVDQYVENAHREDLTTADVVDTWHQLEGLGLDEITIAQRTTTPIDQVRAGLKIANSPVALGTVRKYPQMTFDQGEAIAEFEDDKDAVGKLVDAIENDRPFEHVVQRVRDDREQQDAIDTLAAEIRAGGGVVIDTHVGYGTSDQVAYLTHLREGGKPITVSSHETCEGHAAVVVARSRWNTEKGGYDVGAEAGHVCLDWRKYGHTSATDARATTAPVSKMTKAEKAAAEREKARVDAGDAAWVSATTVRRAWLRDLAQRRTAPDGVERYILGQLMQAEFYIEADPVALLGMLGREVPVATDEEPEHPFAAEAGNAKPGRQVLLSLWLMLAGEEDGLDDPGAWRSSWRANEARDYLAAIARFGYELAPIERCLVDGEEWRPEPA